jgi:hypothetical protein
MDDEDPADIGAGADVLEARYRRILTLLPAAYREHRGEEMISTLLDGAPRGRRWPSIAELASLAALAIRLRVGDRVELAEPSPWARSCAAPP